MIPTKKSKITTLDDWVKKLQTPLEKGLASQEVQERLVQYGFNEIIEKKQNRFLKFFSYFWGPIPWMIEIALVLSAVVEHWADFYIILVLLIINAVVGFWEEFQAGNAIAALKARLALRATVLRDGEWKRISARELVPGDVIRLHLGMIIPADAVLLQDDSVEVDQSALTGESLPVERQTGDIVYSGSILRQGEIDALVIGTGKNTYLGKTAQLVSKAKTVSHFQKAVLKIGNFLIFSALSLVILILAVAYFRGDRMLTTLQFVLVLVVAAVPVAMPAVLSITMAVGARILAKKNAIVSRLSSIEELAGVDVLCSDKTGTLTQNKLTLGDPFCLPGYSPDKVILSAALVSRKENEDPIDLAILEGVRDIESLHSYTVSHFQAFDPVRKRAEAVVKAPNGKIFSVAKGAPQVILALAENAPIIQAQVNQAIQKFATRGFRSLGVARTNEKGEWQMEGVLPLYDPPRSDSKSTIAAAASMGICIKMVTGDQVAIAKEIARQLNLGTDILDATLLDLKNSDKMQLQKDEIDRADGFAQVFPEHKYRIVEVLEERGHIVGMTGDGVNDAPALKKAHAGIAVSNATDAARAAASMILLTPGLSVIIDALKESRRIFQRMHSYAIYRIAETIRVLLFMSLSILVFNFYPVTAIMIVLLALLNDGAILSIAYDRVVYSNQPEKWNMRRVIGVSTLLGITGVIASFGLFYLGERVFYLSRETIQSLIYLKLSVAGHINIFVTRTRGSFWSVPPSRILLVAVVGTQVIATFIAVYGLWMPALGWQWAGFVWGYALVWFLVNDQVKKLGYRIFAR